MLPLLFFLFLIQFCVKMSLLLAVQSYNDMLKNADIISSSFVTLELEGYVEHIALWDIVLDKISMLSRYPCMQNICILCTVKVMV